MNLVGFTSLLEYDYWEKLVSWSGRSDSRLQNNSKEESALQPSLMWCESHIW